MRLVTLFFIFLSFQVHGLSDHYQSYDIPEITGASTYNSVGNKTDLYVHYGFNNSEENNGVARHYSIVNNELVLKNEI